jgi:hypothetical protein
MPRGLVSAWRSGGACTGGWPLIESRVSCGVTLCECQTPLEERWCRLGESGMLGACCVFPKEGLGLEIRFKDLIEVA